MILAGHHGQGLLQLKDITARNQIPHQYLEQIFNRLVKGGVVRSVRGKKGGYELAQSPDKLTVLRVVEILEGELSGDPASAGEADAISQLFDQAAARLREILAVNFADLAARQQKLRKNVMFYI